MYVEPGTACVIAQMAADFGGVDVSAVLVLLVVLRTAELMERFRDMSGAKRPSGDTRVYLARGPISLIGEFPWFGVGGGAFESTLMKYQRESHAFRMQMAHNDYLQYLAELGFFGVRAAGGGGSVRIGPIG